MVGAGACDQRHCAGATFARDDIGTRREGSSIGFHWDMDLEVMRDHGLGLHPHLSTVTYLSDAGAPTAVAAQRRPDIEAGVRLQARRRVCLSFPSVGKHFSFDGRYLHGAPAATPPAAHAKQQAKPSAPPISAPLRVTFLVNIWLGYTPAGVRRLSPSSPLGSSAAPRSSAAATRPSPAMLAPVPSPGCEPCPHETLRLPAEAARRRFPIMWIGDEVDVELSLATPAALPDGGGGRTVTVCGPAGASGPGERVLPVCFEEGLALPAS